MELPKNLPFLNAQRQGVQLKYATQQKIAASHCDADFLPRWFDCVVEGGGVEHMLLAGRASPFTQSLKIFCDFFIILRRTPSPRRRHHFWP